MHYRIIEIPYQPSSSGYLSRFSGSQHAVLLSSSAPQTAGRYDILCAKPIEVIEASGNETVDSILARIDDAIQRYTTQVDSFDYLESGLPFIAGAVGLLAYSSGEELHGVNSQTDRRWPKAYAGIYQWAIIQDHGALRSWLVADNKLASEDWQSLCTQLVAPDTDQTADGNFTLTSAWRSSLEYKQYAEKFLRLQEYIRNGDCYQANLTRQFTAGYHGDPVNVFNQLQQLAPAPFAAYVRKPGAAMVSCSPERFIALHDGRAVTQPIKGTRPRGTTPQQDAELIAELAASAKDRAENLMIVDLMRNDFGKVCRTGSVSVPELFRVRSYSNVHHLVSTVTGLITEQSPQTALRLLRACMAGGSVTGAPKKRAMEIIRELEPHGRSIYCGTLFYLNRDGKMDSSILIRSLLFCEDDEQQGKASVYCWGGGGIVADSDCQAEFEESQYKIDNLLHILGGLGDMPQPL